MKITTLDEETIEWKIPSRIAQGNKRKTSNLHSIAKEIIRRKFPHTSFYEEVPVPIQKKKKLYLDFYIPSFMLAVEVNGAQHYKFNSFYHKNKMEFLMSKQNDVLKKQWCELNDIRIISLPYNEQDNWENMIDGH